MGLYAPYAVAETESTEWKPGEKLAASAFVAMTFLLVLEITIGVWRLFKRKQGLYYWSMFFALIGIIIDAIGMIVKYFLPNPLGLWPLYTLFLVGGWSIYAPAQLLVLYSRLHLVNQSRRLQRLVLAMIMASILFLIIPTWIIAWPAEDPRHSSLWSPRKGFVDRITQTGFTVVECAIGGIYVWSLYGLLQLMRSPLQRRVMHDLIYVTVIGVCLDIVVICLVYTNQLGLSHPIQSFSYIVKLRLEFIVLNQLMAVAAKGLKKHSFEGRKYREPWTDFTVKTDESSRHVVEKQTRISAMNTSSPDIELLVPDPAFPSQPTFGSHPRTNRAKHEEPDEQIDLTGSRISMNEFITRNGAVMQHWDAVVRSKERAGPDNQNIFDATNIGSMNSRPSRYPFAYHQRNGFEGDTKLLIPNKEQESWRARSQDNNDEDADEIGMHMWENRGSLIVEAPWFKRQNRV